MSTPHRIGMALAVMTGVVLIAPTTASANVSAASGESFSQHVRACAQTMGFSGHHNPGMHRGNAGWDGLPCHE